MVDPYHGDAGAFWGLRSATLSTTITGATQITARIDLPG
jgi:hypothetical protein